MVRFLSGHAARLAPAVVFACAGIPAQAQSWNMYQGNTSLVLPYYLEANAPHTNPTQLNWNSGGTFQNQAVQVEIAIGGKPLKVTLDTGSTGIAISKDYLPPGALNGLTPVGYGAYNYNSSGNSPSGTFYNLPVSLLGKLANGQAASATTTVTVLVTNEAGTAYMGVGNNRDNVYSGVYNPALSFQQNVTAGNIHPISSAGFNPLINVSLNGAPLPNQGYVVMNNQVVVGLTAANNGYSFVKLTQQSNPGTNLWDAIPIALASGTGASYVPATVLHDTGIGYAFVKPLPNGGTISVAMPGMPPWGAFYSFKCSGGASSSLAGCPIESAALSTEPFLNTGRQFFSGFNYLFDPTNGFVGYALSDSGLTTEAQVIPLLALQSTVNLPGGFATTLPVALFGATTLTATNGGTAAFNASFLGLGNNLTLGGGTFAFNGGIDLGGGSLSVQQGTASINAGLAASLVTVAPQAVLNNGTGSIIAGNLSNAGTTSNSGVILGNVGNTGTLANFGTIAGNLTNSGTTTNNGVITGNVTNTGTLGGTGTIGGNLVHGGVIAPGNSIGTMTVTGNFTQTAGGTYVTEVAGGGVSDRITVSGMASLGGQVVVTALPGMSFAPSTTYTILSAAGGLTGTFASVNELYPFLLSNLSYDANNAYLNLAIGGFAAAAATPTQAAVGAVLDANVNNATGDFATVLGAMAFNTTSNAQAQATLQAISGNNYAGFSTSMVQGMQLFMNNFSNQTGGGGSPMGNRVALAEACDVACDATTPKWGAWGGALGGLGTIGAGQSVGTVTYNAGGFAAGLDRLVTDNFRMGVTAGYSTGTQWVSGFDGMGRSNTFQVGLYGGFAQDKVYADGLIGYAYTWNQMWRNIAVPGLQQRTANGQTGANQWYGQLETGYRFDIGTNANAFVTPFARLQAYTANQNAFTETGAQSLNLSVAQQTTNSLRSVIGAQLGGSMDLGWREKLLMQLRLGWSHEYADVGRPVTATLAGAPAMPFTTFGISPQRDGVVIGLSANTAIAEATSIYLRYEGDISAQDSAHAITAGVRMTW
ncbi:MAG: autotransporter domain-containing protein [Rhodospirillales bacterium]|nr:autotransporter domain-containing protein [Rhodospirillales bacterium]